MKKWVANIFLIKIYSSQIFHFKWWQIIFCSDQSNLIFASVWLSNPSTRPRAGTHRGRSDWKSISMKSNVIVKLRFKSQSKVQGPNLKKSNPTSPYTLLSRPTTPLSANKCSYATLKSPLKYSLNVEVPHSPPSSRRTLSKTFIGICPVVPNP